MVANVMRTWQLSRMEGVAKSLEITAEHFLETYHKKARFFTYNSKQLHHLESFSSDAGINVMVINVQAFAARGADNRRIYDELDDFQSRRPIDVISANRPILILDEPQKMEGAATLKSLEEFKALMVLRYSATHKTTHNKIHRLDALDAYNQKLVKKIAVRGISVKGLAGTNAYLRRCKIFKREVDVLLLAHHGADCPTNSKTFFEIVRPRIAICCSQFDNQFEHPKPDVRQRLFDLNIPIMTTKTGDVLIRSLSPHSHKFRATNLIANSTKVSSELDFTARKSHWLSMNADTLRNLYRPGFKGLR